MRVHIISDMEGVAGIVKWEQVTGGHQMYEEGRRLYTEEINAAVRGARAAGATEIVVMDCHGAGGPWTFAHSVQIKLTDFVARLRGRRRLAARWRTTILTVATRYAAAQFRRGFT